jgi:hypothetical protein
MAALVRTGVSLESDLLEAFDASVQKKGYANRSEPIRDLIREHLVALPKLEPMRLFRRPDPFDHPDWIFEILCGRPHKISVVFAVMWRCNASQ